ncbi:btb/poz domain-containing protein 19-like [Gigaspora margarita]|uniref:Btb/poz domain-containing protein 19-like n=1 Tax=Gigaspora margarita TaxID=4874 RepID=A0A8H3X3N1_GIGMA|nr:btb/poz domain-containing protein 19-like [Gigaspora margarita]
MNLKTISKPHITANVFEIIIKYIYGGIPLFTDVDAPTILGLLSTAKEFGLDELVDTAQACEDNIPSTGLNEDNISYTTLSEDNISDTSLNEDHISVAISATTLNDDYISATTLSENNTSASSKNNFSAINLSGNNTFATTSTRYNFSATNLRGRKFFG